ncbi:uncharacterized protein LOC116192864 [Punica granatum]|uniref:Small ribosomal subunit protein mS41 SAM domain-containing protein n=2 Tax=Punica granatum TaxID=22663 RepID=A0A218WIP4_PUNGR|nr:uncharacterized protein LOC116192864 [Punica granatum]OWM72423.1 hypothetical protein CDL15_Pgr018308 [Punica granatum]PKI76129.1 hypothetical protein CRG98_003490 [Punica granatum]
MAWRQILFNRRVLSAANPFLNPHSASIVPAFSRFFSKPAPYAVKVGIPEFLQGIGGGVEAHVAKLETEIGDFNKLLVTRTLKLKKLGIPCKHRKLILKYSHKYRVGLWRPRAEPLKA